MVHREQTLIDELRRERPWTAAPTTDVIVPELVWSASRSLHRSCDDPRPETGQLVAPLFVTRRRFPP